MKMIEGTLVSLSPRGNSSTEHDNNDDQEEQSFDSRSSERQVAISENLMVFFIFLLTLYFVFEGIKEIKELF